MSAMAEAGAPVADLDVEVLRCERRGSVCRLVLAWPNAFAGARAGQFALLKSLRPGAPLLPRPLSLVPVPGGGLAVVFNIAGEGTRFLAEAVAGERLALIGPLGNAFDAPAEPILIVTDAPHVGTMLALALERRMAGHTDAFVYVTDPAAPHPSDAILLADIAAAGLAPIAAAPGDLAATLAQEARRYIAAGAADFVMAAAQRLAREHDLAGEASLQAPMACGLGVCQVCIHDAQAGRILVCEGPIFPLAVPRFDAGRGHP